MKDIKMRRTGLSFYDYYKSVNETYKIIFSKYIMLHFPFFLKNNESLEQRQINLTNYCMSKITDISGKTILEVGCGNGIQTNYILQNFNPSKAIGVDINQNNIDLAQELYKNERSLSFFVDDAQKLDTILDDSIDILFCIESALHYPDKDLFLKEIGRVLKKDGIFLITDIMVKSQKKRVLIRKWKKKMMFYHWTEQQYIAAFKKAKLRINYSENIVSYLIKGYQGYSKWVNRDNFNSFLKYLKFKFVVFVHVNVYILLLKRRREYFIFVGRTI